MIDLNTQNQHGWVHNLAFLVEHSLKFLRNYPTVHWANDKIFLNIFFVYIVVHT